MAEKLIPISVLVDEAKKVFRDEFNDESQIAVFAPGRVNLIGEHTDYNDGFVMPMALPLVTVIVGKKIEGDEAVVYTTSKFTDTDQKTKFDIPNKNALIRAINRTGPRWASYVKGVVANYLGDVPPAFQAVIHSSVPIGGGLSSSASLEVATYIFLDELTGNKSVARADKALACQKAEHDYAGMPCGIMDQFISLMGKKDHALLIDCRVYIGETGRTLATRLKEHERCTRLRSIGGSALAEHKLDTNHQILFDQTKILARTPYYFQRIIRESIEIFKNPNNINRGTGYFLPNIWKPLIGEFFRPDYSCPSVKSVKSNNFGYISTPQTSSHQSSLRAALKMSPAMVDETSTSLAHSVHLTRDPSGNQEHLTSSHIPLSDQNIVILIVNSNVKHELTGSEYPTRRKHCEEAALILKKVSLRDANMDDIEYLTSINTNEEIVARARHVITEIQRTTDAAEMLKQMNYKKFGELMTDSHYSLKNDFQVSCAELDSLVELALEVEGVLGSRMTGGGFGGCTVSLVYSHVVDKVIENIKRKYKGNPTFYICTPSNGASKV